MSVHRYRSKALAGDYLRAGIGLLVTAGPALLMETQPLVTTVLVALAGLFGLFGLRVGLRQTTVIEASERAIEAQGFIGARLAWHDVERVRLDYFSTRRDGRDGWMQMKIWGPGARIRAESTIEDFERLAAAVAARVPASITMTDTTLGNFRALGIPVRMSGEGAPT